MIIMKSWKFLVFLIMILMLQLAYMVRGHIYIFPWEKGGYEELAMSGDVVSLKKLYRHYIHMPGGRLDATVWLRVGASKSIPEFQYMLGGILDSDGETDEADCWFARAGLLGHDGSALRTVKYYKGRGDEKLFLEWLRWASALDYTAAKLKLADALVADETTSYDELLKAYYLYIDVIKESKDGSMNSKLAKKGVEKLSGYGFDKAQNPAFKEKSFKPSENMKLSVIEMCERF